MWGRVGRRGGRGRTTTSTRYTSVPPIGKLRSASPAITNQPAAGGGGAGGAGALSRAPAPTGSATRLSAATASATTSARARRAWPLTFVTEKLALPLRFTSSSIIPLAVVMLNASPIGGSMAEARPAKPRSSVALPRATRQRNRTARLADGRQSQLFSDSVAATCRPTSARRQKRSVSDTPDRGPSGSGPRGGSGSRSGGTLNRTGPLTFVTEKSGAPRRLASSLIAPLAHGERVTHPPPAGCKALVRSPWELPP